MQQGVGCVDKTELYTLGPGNLNTYTIMPALLGMSARAGLREVAQTNRSRE